MEYHPKTGPSHRKRLSLLAQQLVAGVQPMLKGPGKSEFDLDVLVADVLDDLARAEARVVELGQETKTPAELAAKLVVARSDPRIAKPPRE